MHNNRFKYLLLMLKGCAMGAADVVPGVSGGTIAFISGIYEELIDSIRRIDLQALRLLLKGRVAECWRHVNGSFLLAVVAGIGVAVFTLARIMTRLLESHPIEVWSFFFGLIIASAAMVAKEVGKWQWQNVVSVLIGTVAAWWITASTPAQTPDTWWFILLSGAIAICAMILPGISGAFILLLLGKYQFILQAVSTLQIPVLLLFCIGAACGIVAFSHLLSWLLRNWHDIAVATLMGFMIGSLNKVWPWKQTLETYTDSHGKVVPLIETNVSPAAFDGDARLGTALLLCAAGMLLIAGIEFAGSRLRKNDRKQ